MEKLILLALLAFLVPSAHSSIKIGDLLISDEELVVILEQSSGWGSSSSSSNGWGLDPPSSDSDCDAVISPTGKPVSCSDGCELLEAFSSKKFENFDKSPENFTAIISATKHRGGWTACCSGGWTQPPCSCCDKYQECYNGTCECSADSCGDDWDYPKCRKCVGNECVKGTPCHSTKECVKKGEDCPACGSIGCKLKCKGKTACCNSDDRDCECVCCEKDETCSTTLSSGRTFPGNRSSTPPTCISGKCKDDAFCQVKDPCSACSTDGKCVLGPRCPVGSKQAGTCKPAGEGCECSKDGDCTYQGKCGYCNDGYCFARMCSDGVTCASEGTVAGAAGSVCPTVAASDEACAPVFPLNCGFLTNEGTCSSGLCIDGSCPTPKWGDCLAGYPESSLPSSASVWKCGA